MDVQRNLTHWALENPLFTNHMSFIIGPRQVGKTTLIQNHLRKKYAGVESYFNWDNEKILRLYRENPYFFEVLEKPSEQVLIAFDEIHKRRNWKRYLKGAYDTYKKQFRFVITGSGRLDLFQRGGDSLAGRYDPYFLFPFSPGELEKRNLSQELSLKEMINGVPISESTIEQWEKLGPFPEPFLSSSEAKAKRWWQQYKIRVTEEDIRDLTKLESLDLVKDLLIVLPARVGSPLSLNSLREDLNCAHSTMQRYIKTLNQVFFTFELSPYSRNLQKVIRKEKKLYFFNFLAIDDPGVRFENMVALLLYQACHRLSEQGLGNYELFYLRDQSRREVDFVLVKDSQPLLLVEAKYKDIQFGSPSRYYQQLLKIPLVQIVRTPKITITRPEGLILSIHQLAAVTG